jgi:hypothetical protein
MARNPLQRGIPWDIQTRLRNLPAAPPQSPEARRETVGRTQVVYPPSVEKLPESVDFVAQDYAIALAAVLNQTASSANLRFVLPPGNVGWLQGFTVYVLTPTALTSVQWQLRINGGPVPGWTIQNSPGVANIYRDDFSDLRVRLGDSSVVDVLITNLNANGPWTVGGRIQGWFHSATAEQSRYAD